MGASDDTRKLAVGVSIQTDSTNYQDRQVCRKSQVAKTVSCDNSLGVTEGVSSSVLSNPIEVWFAPVVPSHQAFRADGKAEDYLGEEKHDARNSNQRGKVRYRVVVGTVGVRCGASPGCNVQFHAWNRLHEIPHL